MAKITFSLGGVHPDDKKALSSGREFRTYLAKGDLALSVGMTGVSTLLAPLLTPFLTLLLAGKTVAVNAVGMFVGILLRPPAWQMMIDTLRSPSFLGFPISLFTVAIFIEFCAANLRQS